MAVSSIVKFSAAEFTRLSIGSTPVVAPIGTVVSQVASHSISPIGQPDMELGVWTCTPGTWRRQVMQAEFCHFLEGECTFTPDVGDAIEIRRGDVVYFPAQSAGIWNIRVTSRKIFMVFGS